MFWKILFVKIRSVQLETCTFFNQAFKVKRAHKNFKVLVLNSEIEISDQHNVIIPTWLLIQDKRQIIKEILIILWWRFIEANTDPFFEIWWKIHPCLICSHRGLLQMSQLYKKYFHWYKKWLIVMDLKLLMRKCFIKFCFRNKTYIYLVRINSSTATILFLGESTLKWPIITFLGFCNCEL